MCGVAGILDWTGAPGENLGAMLEGIRHRGPDDWGDFREGPLAMGMRRLSIIDVAGGHQPIVNEDGTVVAIFNGEIYNYIELRGELLKKGHRFRTNTDTEVLVHLYEEEGADFLPLLNGMFGFAIWDTRQKRLIIGRDRLGIKPMYYARTGNGFVFASEMKAVLASGLVASELDPEALIDYLVYYYIPGERTPFRQIRKLLPGHLLIAQEGDFCLKRWWNLADYWKQRQVSKQEARARIRELFYDSVRLRMRSDVPVGAYLSGGLDSSLVAAVAGQQTPLSFSTFSVAFAQSEFDEMPFARSVADSIGSDHHEIRVTPADAMDNLPNLVWHMDEPNGDSAILPTFLVSQLAAQHVKVALSGIGADELFGGYHRYHAILGKFERLSFLPKRVLHLLQPIFSSLKYEWGHKIDRMVNPLPPWRDYIEKIHRFDSDALNRLSGMHTGEPGGVIRSLFERYPGDDFVNQRMYVDAHSYLPDQILALTDRMSMAVSLEARTPFLDYRLVEFLTGLPGQWKVRGSDWKIILKEALGDLLPGSILNRPKWGFSSPVQNWMRSSHLDAFNQLCRGSHLARDGLIDGRALHDLMSDDTWSAYNANWIWALGILEIWYRIYGETACPAGLSDVNLLEFAQG